MIQISLFSKSCPMSSLICIFSAYYTYVILKQTYSRIINCSSLSRCFPLRLPSCTYFCNWFKLKLKFISKIISCIQPKRLYGIFSITFFFLSFVLDKLFLFLSLFFWVNRIFQTTWVNIFWVKITKSKE